MIRLLTFSLLISITGVLILIVLSDYIFGDVNLRTTGKRLGLVLVWPLAVLSRPGRELLFNYGSKL